MDPEPTLTGKQEDAVIASKTKSARVLARAPFCRIAVLKLSPVMDAWFPLI
jgi:hypothetical protein